MGIKRKKSRNRRKKKPLLNSPPFRVLFSAQSDADSAPRVLSGRNFLAGCFRDSFLLSSFSFKKEALLYSAFKGSTVFPDAV
jgi:hypothetical protein